ncbi:hypothetical protein BX666DRAFT_1847259 [Dichotomocladium elegans]|nr:hypothetical protein BX666DRAFT_1847259 [Dichotomocladium elegans]
MRRRERSRSGVGKLKLPWQIEKRSSRSTRWLERLYLLIIPLLSHQKKKKRSSNELTHLPEAIGCLIQLCFLNVSRNKLERLPEALGHLPRLVELNVSHNRITDLAPCFSGPHHNTNLAILHAKSNAITQLSSQVTNLTQLTSLDLSNNPILMLPAEVSRLASLRRLILKDCPLVSALPTTTNGTITPIPSLKEYCARQIVADTGYKADLCLPPHLHQYLKKAQACSVCRAPFFDTYISRGQRVQKTVGGKTLLLEHRLCSAHWADCDDNDRILAMFATGHQPRQTALSALPRKSILFF